MGSVVKNYSPCFASKIHYGSKSQGFYCTMYADPHTGETSNPWRVGEWRQLTLSRLLVVTLSSCKSYGWLWCLWTLTNSRDGMLSQEEFLLPLLQEFYGGPHVLLFGMLVEPVPEQHGVIAVHIAGISLKVYFSLIKVGFKCRYTVHKHWMQKNMRCVRTWDLRSR